MAIALAEAGHGNLKTTSEACHVSLSSTYRERARNGNGNGNGAQAAAAPAAMTVEELMEAIVAWWAVATPGERATLIDRFGADETWSALLVVMDNSR
jgi:hypothetical protein